MKLIDLLKDVKVKGKFDKNLDIKGIAYDSRKVEKGYLFVAIEGFKVDGHNYIDEARKAGAVVIIVQKSVKQRKNIIKVDSSREALSKISKNFHKDPTSKIKLIGITGTNGKTSTTYIIKNLLDALNYESGVIGSIQNMIGDEILETNITTPESFELNEIFRKMNNKNIKYGVMEVSSHALSLSRVNDINFEVGIFTNLTQDHLDYHKDMEEYFNQKRKLFEVAKLCVINLEDEYGKKLYEKFKNKALTYGFSDNADLYAKDIEMTLDGTKFTAIYKNKKYSAKIPLFGGIYVLNTLAAFGSLIAMEFTMEDIITAHDRIRPVRGRFERVSNNLEVNIIIDFAHTPAALKNVLDIAREITENRLICVFGCGGDRDKDKRPKMGLIAERTADYSFVTSDNPRNENPMDIINEIIAGIPANSNKYKIVQDREEAIKNSIEKAKPGDTVIITGKGHETYQIIGDEIIEFDDKKMAIKSIGESKDEANKNKGNLIDN